MKLGMESYQVGSKILRKVLELLEDYPGDAGYAWSVMDDLEDELKLREIEDAAINEKSNV